MSGNVLLLPGQQINILLIFFLKKIRLKVIYLQQKQQQLLTLY